MKIYSTQAGIELTEEQCKLVNSFERLMKKWNKNICINAIAGNLTLMLLGGTEQNPTPEIGGSDNFNINNVIDHKPFSNVIADGGDW
jgi:hypothetical protein